MKHQLIDFRSRVPQSDSRPRLASVGDGGNCGAGSTLDGFVIDPEALFLFSCTVSRYDARLFDAIQEWLGVNGNLINVQRLKRILKEEHFAGEPVLAAIAAATTDSVNQAKWSRIAGGVQYPKDETDPQPLFYLESGKPMPVVRDRDPQYAEYGFIRDQFEARGVAEPFRPERPANLLLRLRALLGVNARSEVFEYLLVNRVGSPRAIAADCYYSPATIIKTMAEMKLSGFVASRTQGRRKLYSLSPDTWRGLFIDPSSNLTWVVWPRVFSALEQIWVFLDAGELATKSPLEQSSSLRRLLTGGVISQLERGLPEFMFGDPTQHPAELLIPFFTARLGTVLQSLG